MSASQIIKEWRDNPLKFVRDNFKTEPDEWQKDALALAAGTKTRRRICLRACTGPGKSAVLAWIGWHRLSCFGGVGKHPKGAALSGEGRDNLRDTLWAELAKWQSQSDFLKHAFKWTAEKIFAVDHPETWILSARSYAKDADAEAIGRSLSGIHSEYPFVLLDEIGDSPIQLGQKVEQIFTGGVIDGLVAAAGNPTSNTGLLHEIATKQRDRWEIIRITADPDDPKRTPRVDIELAREQINKYGRDNDWVRATILGEFPIGSINTLLSIDEVEASMRRSPPEHDYKYTQKRLGVDVARQGMDATVIFPRQGLMAFKPVVMRGARSNEVAARVAAAKARWGSEAEFVDGTGGYGAGVVDNLLQAGHAPIEVNFSGAPQDERYFNIRSEIWFRMAEWVKRGGALPNDPELVRELTAPTYTFQNGRFRLEEKDQIRKRLGFSPDKADALACTFFLPDMPNMNPDDPMTRVLMNQTRHEYEWDPFQNA